MSRQSRTLQILSMFSLAQPVLRPADLVRELGVSRASVYRDLQALEQSGLLERVAGQGYVLGPAVVELDRQVRLADPLLKAAGVRLRELAQRLQGVVLLCRVHGKKVLCIHQETPDGDARAVSYERGRAMPLYRGATSRIILAHLEESVLRELWESDADALQQSGLASSWPAFLAALQVLREQRYCATHSEVDAGMAGLAVPLMEGKRVLGSLSVVLPVQRLHDIPSQHVLSLLFRVADTLEASLEDARQKARHLKRR